MKKRENFDDYVFRRKCSSEKKCVIIFMRNNLSFDSFSRKDGGFKFSDTYEQNGRRVVFSCFISTDDLYDLFSIKDKQIAIRGGKDHLGIQLRLKDTKTIPMIVEHKTGNLKFRFEYTGRALPYEGPERFRNAHLMRDKYGCAANFGKRRKHREKTVYVSESTSWSVKHPYQGGGFTPR